MKEHPILFKPEMVRALLAGRKTQTRRLATKDQSTTKIEWVKDYPTWPHLWKDRKRKRYSGWIKQCGSPIDIPLKCPYGVPGDQLWVRETWRQLDGSIQYRADADKDIPWSKTLKWKPSIHIKRDDSRINLEVTSIRAERVQDISKKDAMAEGLVEINKSFLMDPECLKIPVKYTNGTFFNDEKYWGHDNPKGAYASYFEEINGKEAWDSNPWVWVIGFNLMNRK